MGKGRLLGSVCALALVLAVPALAATTGTNDTTTGAPANQATTNMNNGTNATGPHHHWAHHAMRMRSSHAGQGDTSQDAQVDQLNDQSLQAARQGQSFQAGASDHGGMGGMSGNTMSPGSGAAGMQNPGAGSMQGPMGGQNPGTGSASGGQHM